MLKRYEKMEKEDLKKQRDRYITKIFWLALQIAFIFSIPAVIGAVAGVFLDSRYGTGRKITVSFLIGTFIFSWILVIVKYRRLSKKIEQLEEKIRQSNNSL